MIKQSSTYPIDDNELILPFTITSAIYVHDSHYIGYELTDSFGEKVDFLDINELKKAISSNPDDFENVKLNKLGHLEIDDYDNLPHKINQELNDIAITNGLYSLLAVDKRKFMPDVVYNYKLVKDKMQNGNQVYKCSFSVDFKNYVKFNPKSKEPFKIELPQPLLMINGIKVTNFSKLFANMNFNNIELDYSLMDLRNCEQIEKMFEYTQINELKLKTFNFKPKLASSLFRELKCNVLDLSDCNFSNINNFYFWFYGSEIGNVKAKRIKTGAIDFKSIFNFTSIDKLDLELFKNIKINEMRKSDNCGIFSNLTCKKFINMGKLPTNEMTKNCNLFKDLIIDVLDLTNLNLDSLEDASYLLSHLHCEKLILPEKLFSKVKFANNMFYKSTIDGDLDLSKVSFQKLTQEGAIKMFYSLTVTGKLTTPTNYGSAENFNYALSNLKVNELDTSKSNYSKAKSVDNFISSSTILILNLPNKINLIPKELKSANKFMLKANVESSNLNEWHFDIAKTLFLQVKQVKQVNN